MPLYYPEATARLWTWTVQWNGYSDRLTSSRHVELPLETTAAQALALIVREVEEEDEATIRRVGLFRAAAEAVAAEVEPVLRHFVR